MIEYRQMRLGFLWIGVSHIIFCLGLAFIFYPILGQDFINHLFYVSIGLAVWNLLQALIMNGVKFFDANSGYIKSGFIDLHFLSLTGLTRLLLIFFIQFFIFMPLYFLVSPNLLNIGYSCAGLALVILFGYLSVHALSGFGILFPDFKELTNSVMRMMFFITPVFWVPTLESSSIRTALVEFNPFFHLINVVRAPMIGDVSYQSLLIVVGLNVILGLATPGIYKHISLRSINKI